ncbi:sugar phosphate isomerase/epimerase family protein [Desulfogranum japonicum]|uniref:sugar phosphate isomerase/epimerase family protein n=1 Tax=Desulfogranum japonicum TaxID=231447 RepID=UPI0003F4E0CF|nr:TIM barrel protein [Desulfogranum japonicum]
MYHNEFRSYRRFSGKIFINAPFSRLRTDLLPTFIDNGLQPEIGLEGNDLWDTPQQEFIELAELLNRHGLHCTLHAPFHDLTPGGFDREIIRVTREKLTLVFNLLPVFQPKSIVCHLGYNNLKHSQDLNRWLDVCTETWTPLLESAQRYHVPVMFENTYEHAPSIHMALLERLAPLNPKCCLDTGHILAFSTTSWENWYSAFLPHLGQLHLHDNNGSTDQHLALGQGIFHFDNFFSELQNKEELPIITLEQRSVEDVLHSLSYLARTIFAP